MVLCAPAFAGVAAAIVDEAAGCCCSSEEETRHVTVESKQCQCAACACSIEHAPPVVPLTAATNSVVLSWVALPSAEVIASIDQVPHDESSAGTSARGPPPGERPPLYILHDSWLI